MFIDIPTPLKRGTMTHDNTGPRLQNCPTANSKYMRGTPTRTIKMKKGIKKAPFNTGKILI
jgi:hypothetical protein